MQGRYQRHRVLQRFRGSLLHGGKHDGTLAALCTLLVDYGVGICTSSHSSKLEVGRGFLLLHYAAVEEKINMRLNLYDSRIWP